MERVTGGTSLACPVFCNDNVMTIFIKVNVKAKMWIKTSMTFQKILLIFTPRIVVLRKEG